MQRQLRHFTLAILFALCTLNAHAATEVAGVRFEDHSSVAGEALVLNGAGVRTRLMFKVYAMGLYLPAASSSDEAVIARGGPKQIRIVLLRDLEAKQFADALGEGLEKNHTTEQLTALRPSIDTLRAALLRTRDAPSGTRVLLESLPNGRTRLTINEQQRGEEISDSAFFPALLRVWLGKNPVDADLKKRLLGAPT